MKNVRSLLIAAVFVPLVLVSCRGEEEIFVGEEIKVTLPEYSTIDGFYLLNEGNMGSNKSTLDYCDLRTGIYHRNIFAEANPSVVKEMGDVGNDLQIYGSKLYAVINCSNKVDVMQARTAQKIGQINIPNCRYICFHKGYAYISSYAGPVEINPNYSQRGFVAKVDTATLAIVGQCLVGFQPDEMAVVNDKLYVANSGGYMFPNYENTVSVIDLEHFSEIKRISVAPNLHRLRADRHGHLWVSSRGDYYGIPSRLYCIDLQKEVLSDSLPLAVSNFYLDGDSLYIYGVEWSYVTHSNETTYGIVDVKTKSILTRHFISDSCEKMLKIPYGIHVHPHSKDIYITDAKNYVSPGTLFCFDKSGAFKWKVRTGDIPAHFSFLGQRKN